MRGRNHRFPKIGTIDNYRHFWMISVWAAYLILYVIAEKVVTTDYYSVHIALDDLIPFCEWFVIPYCLWMALLACTAVYLLFWDAENFKRFTAFIGLGFIPVIIFDMIFPNGQDLRPLAFEHHNIATWLVGHIYAADKHACDRLRGAVRRVAVHARLPQAQAPLGHASPRNPYQHFDRLYQAAFLRGYSLCTSLQCHCLVAGIRRHFQKAEGRSKVGVIFRKHPGASRVVRA